MTLNLLPQDGQAHLIHHFFSEEECKVYLDYLTQHIPWNQEPILIFGKNIMQPRLTAWYGDADKAFGYSGIVMKTHAWTENLKVIKERVESLAKIKFSGVLLNQYRDGNDSIGWHRDNELELGKNPTIAAISFGATRKFQFRHYMDKKLKTAVELPNGSLLLMKNETQQFWEHQIPKTSKPTGVRISLTFRRLFN